MRMTNQARIAVIGAGVIGATIASALAREGHAVVLIDTDEPGRAGASFGNVGHIAAELVEPLPSPALLLNFWRELFLRGGALDMPLRRVPALLPWLARFGIAAFRRRANTTQLAPLVMPAAAVHERTLARIGRDELLSRHGHYEIWLDDAAETHAHKQAAHMASLGIKAQRVPADGLHAVQSAARAATSAGVWCPDSAHVADPFEVTRAFVADAIAHSTEVVRACVRRIAPASNLVTLHTDHDTLTVEKAIVCAGVASKPLLEPLGLNVPLQSVRGYHIEMPGQAALLDAPILYANEKILVTPMSGRLRASSYMEFETEHAPSDPRKPLRLRERVRQLGYDCPLDGDSWVGARPVLPDYLPGIGRVPSAPNVFYAIGHQHIGLTLAPITAELISDLVAARPARIPVEAFDLQRFGRRLIQR
jgi:glycine/D-amino acid oxidase-like deaminating enzyme